MRVAHLVWILLAGAVWAEQYTISTYAGGAPPPTPVAALNASIGQPQAVATDALGNVYFNGLHCVFKRDRKGVLTRVAGNARAGFSGDGGPAVDAQLFIPGPYATDNIDVNYPSGIAVDQAGDFYFADTGNGRVRKVSGGIITTVAGGGACRNSCDGLAATSVRFLAPSGLAVDGGGNLYISDAGAAVYKVSRQGILTTLPTNAGEYGGSSGLAVDGSGNLYIAELWNARVRRLSPDGTIVTVAGAGKPGYSGDGGPASNAQLAGPVALAVDRAGALYIADIDPNQIDAGRVRVVSPDGTMATVAGDGLPGYAGDGGPAIVARLYPWGVALDGGGNLLIADAFNARVRAVTPEGSIATIAGSGSCCYSGDGGPAAAAQLGFPSALGLDSAGTLYIADNGNHRVRKVSSDGVISTVAGSGDFGYSGDGGSALDAQIGGAQGLAADNDGNLYIADFANYRVRKVSAAGIIATVAGDGTRGFSGDGGPATQAQLSAPFALAVDDTGNLYIADDNRVRRISPLGIITTVAGNGAYGDSGDGGPATSAALGQLHAIAVDAAGNVYTGGTDRRVRRISPAGIITTVAGTGAPYLYSGDGGSAAQAAIGDPGGLAVDGFGNLYIADTANGRVRLVSRDGTITTLAGSGGTGGWFGLVFGYSGDGGPATAAQLGPWGLAVDGRGNIYVGDAANGAVRLLQASASGLR
jgi:sugar lactone lactonase YvrE